MRVAPKREWAILAVSCALSVPLFLSRGRMPRIGTVLEAPITVTPADQPNLGCELGRAVGTYRCAYRDDETPFRPPPAPHDLVQPFLTTERALYLVPGLFDAPAVRTHLERQYSGARFTARCQLRLVERVLDFKFRFHVTDPWVTPKEPSWVGEPLSCVVE
ncbi:MAG TPA: hypothetical protein VF395_22375 [Polyangiaceae bacterium]